MQILNFSHPLTTEQMATLVTLMGDQKISGVKEVRCQVDQTESLHPQARKLVDSVGWSPHQWQSTPFILVPPGMAPVALAVCANVHGRCGYWPTILRLRPEGQPPKFVPAELVGLDQLRDAGRMDR